MLTISMCMSNEDSVDSTQAMLRKPFYSSSLEALADIYNKGSNNAKKGFSKLNPQVAMVICMRLINARGKP